MNSGFIPTFDGINMISTILDFLFFSFLLQLLVLFSRECLLQCSDTVTDSVDADMGELVISLSLFFCERCLLLGVLEFWVWLMCG